MFKVIILVTLAIVIAGLVGVLAYLIVESRNVSSEISKSYVLSDREMHDQGLETLNHANSKWSVNTIGIKRSQVTDALSDLRIRNEHQAVFEKAILLMGQGSTEESISRLKDIPENSFYFNRAQINIQKGWKHLLEKELALETDRRVILEEQLKSVQEELAAERLAKQQEQTSRERAEKDAENQRLEKERQSQGRVTAEEEARKQKLAKEKEMAESDRQRKRALEEEKAKIVELARTRPTVQAIISGELKFYMEPLPSYAADGVSDAVKDIAEIFSGYEIYSFADVREVYNEYSADLVISWVRDYGTHTLGEAIYKSHIKVGLGSTNCQGDWRAFTSNTVKKVLWHEIGHSMGYGHSSDPDNVMYATTDTRYEVDHIISVVIAGNWYKTIPLCNARKYRYTVESDDVYKGFTLRVLPPGSDPNLVSGGRANVYTNCGAAGMVQFSDSCTVSSGSKIYIENDQQNQAIRLSGEIVDTTSTTWPEMTWDSKSYRYDTYELEHYWDLFN